MRRAALAAAVTVASLSLLAGVALAHPLGNFSTNRFTGLEIGLERIVVHYVIDLAEIATFQELEVVDADGDGVVSAEELSRYAAHVAERLPLGMTLTAGGDPVPLRYVDSGAELLPGEGGLDTLRVEVTYAGPLPDEETTLVYIDRNYASLVGWKEVIAYPAGGQGIASSTVPATSVSDRLYNYPEELLQNPVVVSVAEVEVAPGARGAGAAVGTGARGPRDLARGFSSLIERDASVPVVLGAFALALGFGALHALSPGHGKTIMAAYLLGTGGKARHAVVLGAAVSAMHTASVLALGGVTLWASRLLRPEELYPWMSAVSGVVVLALGAYLLTTRLRRRAAAGAGHHEHEHGHGHDGHHHGPRAGVDPLSWQGLSALALSGGLLPSPSALVVLLGAVALGKLAFGLALVAAFSIGLAATLAALGLVVLRARAVASHRLGGRASRAVRALPLMSAGAITLAGVVLTGRAVLMF